MTHASREISQGPRQHSHLLAALLIFTTAFVVYYPALRGEFLSWDDAFTIQQNPRLNPPSLQSLLRFWPPIVRANADDDALTGNTYRPGAWRVNHVYGLYIPATYTVWSALAAVAQTRSERPGSVELNPWIFHAANVALHAAAAIVVFALLRRLLNARRAWLALAGAMFFLLHPLQVESVAWIDGTKDVLCGLMSLIALWQHIIAMQETDSSQRRWHQAAATVAFLLALLSKPSAVTVPLLAIVLDVVVLRRAIRDALIQAIPWLALSVIFGTLAAMAQPATDLTLAPLWARPFVASDAIAFYLWKLIWPLRLGIDYGRRPDVLIGRWWFYLTWLAPAALLTIAWKLRRRHPLIVAGVLVFMIAPLTTLGLTTFLFQEFSTTADHYLYVAMLGPALATAAVLASIEARRAKRLAGGLVTVLLVAWAGRTWVQAYTWRTDRGLFLSAVEVNDASFVAHNNLGVSLRNDDPQSAERHFRRAYELKEDYPEAARNLADLYAGMGRGDEAAKWRAEYERIQRERAAR